MNKVSNAKELGVLVWQRRKQAELTLKDAAGMAGVGSVSFLNLNEGNLLFSSDLLPEGNVREQICKSLKISADSDFAFLKAIVRAR